MRRTRDWSLILLMAGILMLLPALAPVEAADALPAVKLDASSIAPRAIEDLTGKNITRDYAYAWQSLARALEENRAGLLDAYFTGFAKDSLTRRIADQKKNGLRARYTDHGHDVHAFFYSPNGDAMQLRDHAKLEIEFLDKDKVIHREQVALNYLVIMTPGADRWVVRSLEALPSF